MRLSKLAAAVVLAAIGTAMVPHAAANTVVAQTSTSVVLSYRLVDLDLDDGITPWVVFSDTSQLALAYGTEGSVDPMVVTRQGGIFAAPDVIHGSADGRVQAQYSVTGHSTVATVTADLYQAGAAPSALAAVGHFYGSDTDPDFGLASPFEGEYALQLSPNTALIFEATTVLNASLDTSALTAGAFQQYLLDAQLGAFITVTSYVDVLFDVGGDYVLLPQSWTEYGSNLGTSSIVLQARLNPDDQAVSDEQSLSEMVYASYYNGSATSANVRFTYFATSDIYTSVFDLPPIEPPVDPEWPPIDPPVDPGFPPVTPAIPEPSTYALMLLGLGGIAVAARQRRRQMAG